MVTTKKLFKCWSQFRRFCCIFD